MTDKELLKKALHRIEYHYEGDPDDKEAIESIKARLTQSEPVTDWPLAPKTGYYNIDGKRVWLEAEEPFPETAPQKKEWVGLTDEEVAAIHKESTIFNTPMYFAQAIEAKLKEKNT